MAIKDLLNVILQLDALDIQQQNANVEAQKAKQGYLNSFISNLQYLQSPEQLTALQNTYSKSFGLDPAMLTEVSANYVPGLEAAKAQAVGGYRKAARGTRGEETLNRATAFSQLTGMDEATAERAQLDASSIRALPATAQRASVFNRIGFQPGPFSISEAFANLPPSEIQEAARYAANTAIPPATQAALGLQASGQVLQRDIAQGQLNLGGQQLALSRISEANRYNLGLLPYLAPRLGGAGAGGADKTFEQMIDAAKAFKDLERAQASGTSKAARSVYDKFLRDIAGAMAGVNLPQGTQFNPSMLERLRVK